MVSFYKKYKELILYIVFGVLTTLVNIVVYWLMYDKSHMSNVLSTVTAWILSVLFAYITNKLFVFESKSFAARLLLAEMGSFFLCRLLTGLMDLGIMYLFVDMDITGFANTFFTIHIANSWEFTVSFAIVVKVASNVLVVILNYIASRLLIFKKKEKA